MADLSFVALVFVCLGLAVFVGPVVVYLCVKLGFLGYYRARRQHKERENNDGET